MRVIVANRADADDTFRIAISPDGAAIADEHLISGQDQDIAAKDSGSTIGFVVGSGDIVRVYAGSANLSFTATGETMPE